MAEPYWTLTAPASTRGADVFAGGPDGQVGEVVAVEVVEEDPSGQGDAEQVTRLGGPDHAWAVLGEGLVATHQPGVGAVHDVDRPGVGGAAQVLKGGADGQIRGAGVEEPGRQRRPELVACLGGAADPGPWTRVWAAAPPAGWPTPRTR